MGEETDLVTVYHGDGLIAEVESANISAILESSSIPAVLVGSSSLPSLAVEVRVPPEYVDRALAAIAEAQAAGPAAAEQGERESERQPPDIG